MNLSDWSYFAAPFLWMETCKDLAVAVLSFVVGLLRYLDPKPVPHGGEITYKLPQYTPRQASGVIGTQVPLWVLILLYAAALLLLILLARGLFMLLRRRISPVPPGPFKNGAYQGHWYRFGRWLLLLLKQLVSGGGALAGWAGRLAGKLRHRLALILRRWLPPQTPAEQVLRTYESFLRWGSRQGISRRPSETPTEYLQRLGQAKSLKSIPFEEIRQLTAVFLETRYSSRMTNWQDGEKCRHLLKKIHLHTHS